MISSGIEPMTFRPVASVHCTNPTLRRYSLCFSSRNVITLTKTHLIVSPHTRFLHIRSSYSCTYSFFPKSRISFCTSQFKYPAIQRKSQHQLLSIRTHPQQSLNSGHLEHRTNFGLIAIVQQLQQHQK